MVARREAFYPAGPGNSGTCSKILALFNSEYCRPQGMFRSCALFAIKLSPA
jgi:hypothetical protein